MIKYNKKVVKSAKVKGFVFKGNFSCWSNVSTYIYTHICLLKYIYIYIYMYVYMSVKITMAIVIKYSYFFIILNICPDILGDVCTVV